MTGLPRVAACAWLALVLGCAATQETAQEPSPLTVTSDGTAVVADEYEFRPPSPPWRFLEVTQGDEFGFAYLKFGACSQPCQSTMAYDEEPFGYSLDLEVRMREFFRRYLWASRIKFGPVQTKRLEVFGNAGLEGVAVGTDAVTGAKARGRVLLGRRGERVVALFLTQWRAADGAFDAAEDADFDRFAQSFRFRRKSFFEQLGGAHPQ